MLDGLLNFLREAGLPEGKPSQPTETLADISSEQPPDSVKPVSPPEPSSMGGERRQATIVFSDLSGYTAMNEKLDPEEVEAITSRIKAKAELRSNVVFLGFQAVILSTLIPSSNFIPSITSANQLDPLGWRHIR